MTDMDWEDSLENIAAVTKSYDVTYLLFNDIVNT